MDEAERDFIVTMLATNMQAFPPKEVQTVEQMGTDRVMSMGDRMVDRMEKVDIEEGGKVGCKKSANDADGYFKRRWLGVYGLDGEVC